MKYTILLWPHANVRYRSETQKLAEAELGVMLSRIAPEVEFASTECMGMPALELTSDEKLSDNCIFALQGHSLLYGLFENREDGALMPLCGREKPLLGEDLPGILKYKGKTNEMFTQLLVNVALYSASIKNPQQQIKLLDPMCGRATTLFVGANRGWSCTGADLDKADLKEAEQFFKRYLEYHRYKHSIERTSLTVQGRKPANCVQFTFADTPEHFKQKQTASVRLVNADATVTRETFGQKAFHMIVCDLPYGVQHASHGGSLEQLLAKVLPGWREALMPGGTIAVSFNAQTLKTAAVHECMEKAGLEPLTEGHYQNFSHWVEQAVTRDIAVCRRK